MKTKTKSFITKIALMVVCVFMFTAGFLTLGLNSNATTAYASTTEHTHDVEFTELTDLSQFESSGKYYLGDTIPAVSENITIASGVEITLCLNGKTLNLGEYCIINNGTLTIYDCQGTGKLVNSGSYLINNVKEFNLYSGTIEDSVSANYGVLYSKGSTANANIYGGTINGYKRAIYNVFGSTLNVTGGTISSTSYYAIDSSGDSNNTSTVEISGGTISGTYGVVSANNYTSISISGNPIITGSSTGVVLWGDNNVISGGTITGGTNYGVQNDRGTLTISGGTISSGNANGVQNSGQLTVAGGKITGKDNGIYNSFSTSSLTVTGGEITATNGSGISTYYGITVEISGGTISGSTYGVIINHADMKLYLSSNPTITGGTADVYYRYNGLVYAHSADETTVYNGQSLTLGYYRYSDGVVAVCNVTNDNINKFTLESSDYALLLGGEDTPQDDLVLHKHDYSTVNYDNDTHWNECSCGDKTGVTAHAIINGDSDCTTDEICSCGKVIVAKNASHTYAYSASDNVITETCSVDGCTVHTATATIVKPEGTLTYNGNEFNATVDYSSAWAGGTLMISYTRDGDIISAGKITASITISGKTASVTYTIEKANQTAPSGVNKVDTSYIDTVDGKIAGVTNAMEYKLSTESNYIAISGTEITNLASGTYYVRFAENDNYNASEYVSVTINKGGKRTATITNVSDIGKTYNGTAVSNPTYTYTNGADGQITITWYADNGGVKGTALSSAPLSAGTYWVGVKASEGDIYNAVSEVTQQFTIGKATYDMSGIDFDNGVFTYSGNANSIYISGDLPTGVSVDYTNNGVTNATTEPITVTATFTGDSANYNAIPNKTATITINPKNISGATITLGSALTYTGEEQTQTLTSVVIDGLTVTYDISGNKQTNVGASDYTLTVTGKGNFTGTANKAWNIAKAQAEISVDTTPIVKTYGETWTLPIANSNFGSPVANLTVLQMKDADTYTLTFTVEATSNYLGDTESISVTINKATVGEPTIDSKIYTSSTLTADISNTSDYTVQTNDGGIDVGNYDVVLALVDSDNYKWSTVETAIVTLQFSITAETNEFTTTPDIEGWTYGQTASEPTGGAKFGEIVFTYYDSERIEIAKPSNAGSYYLKASVVADGNNYGAISTDFIPFTIEKATAVITVDTTPIVKTYGDVWTLPMATTNFGTIVCDKVVGDLVNAGTYTVTYTVAGTSNYNGDTESINVTINKQKIDKPSADTTVFTYTGSAQTYNVVADSLYTISGTTRTDAGSQDVTIALIDKNNYEWADESTADVIYSFAIGKANAVITVDTTPIVKTYGDVWSLPTATTNFGAVTCDKVVGDLVNADTYTVTYTVAGTSNYNGDVKTISVTINKSTYDMTAITFAGSIVEYNGQTHSLAISGTLPNGVTVEYDGNDKVDAGVYTVTANFIYDTVNYNVIEPMTATLTINQDKVIDHIGETTTDKPSVEVTTEGGFAPNIEIIITELPAKGNKVEEVINAFDKVGAVYDITMESEGVEIQPSGEITIKLLIPNNLIGKDFRIYHNHNGEFTEIEYTVDGDYAVFTVDKLSEFSLVYYQFPWWIIVIVVAVLAGGAVAGVVIYKKKKAKKA